MIKGILIAVGAFCMALIVVALILLFVNIILTIIPDIINSVAEIKKAINSFCEKDE